MLITIAHLTIICVIKTFIAIHGHCKNQIDVDALTKYKKYKFFAKKVVIRGYYTFVTYQRLM